MLLELQVPFVAGHATSATVADMEQAIHLNLNKCSRTADSNKGQGAQEKAAAFHRDDAHRREVGSRAWEECSASGRLGTSCR